VIIFGTGFYLVISSVIALILSLALMFDILQVERDITFRGIGDLTLKQYFESEGGATGYYGTTFPGFPNLFTVVGQFVD
jgi:hypothetical protein